MAFKKYQHIFFDLDHTIWDFETNAKESMQDLFNQLDLKKKLDIGFEKFYTNYSFHNKVMWEKYHNKQLSRDDLKWKRMWRTLLDFKLADEPLARHMSEAFLEILPTKKALFPHTNELLQYLLDKGYNLHLITNGFEQTQWSKLSHSGLGKYFTQVITSEASNSMKPHKEIFDYALEKAGARLEESIMIGDNLDADIIGALNAGMDCVYVNHINEDTDLKPTYTVCHLRELEEIF